MKTLNEKKSELSYQPTDPHARHLQQARKLQLTKKFKKLSKKATKNNRSKIAHTSAKNTGNLELSAEPKNENIAKQLF